MAIRDTKITAFALIITTLITASTTIVITLISSGYFTNENNKSSDDLFSTEDYKDLNDSLLKYKKKYTELNISYLKCIKNNSNSEKSKFRDNTTNIPENIPSENNSNNTYSKTNLSGQVQFDYSDNDGVYKIGSDEHLFITKWSSASRQSIHVYNDFISGVALAKDEKEIDQIIDPSVFNFSSRTRTPNVGEIIILKNNFDNYAVLKINEISNRSRGDESDVLKFTYMVMTKR